MNCPHDPKVFDYADGEMAPAEKDEFAVHLQGCPACQGQLRDFRRLQERLRELPSPRLEFDLSQNFAPGPSETRRRGKPARIRWLSSGFAGLATASCLALGVWLGGLLVGGTGAVATPAAAARVFDPVPPGGLCAAPELCYFSRGIR